MSRQPDLPEPTGEELASIRSRSLDETFARCSPIPKAIELAVFQGHTRRGPIRDLLGLDSEVVGAGLDGTSGVLRWEKPRPDPENRLGDWACVEQEDRHELRTEHRADACSRRRP